ncbi:MAG: VanZ family protein [Muribaculaceae bacterium]|nr:VanZ family protein [Muribaculaceae bacterium]
MEKSGKSIGVKRLHVALRRVPHWLLSVVCLGVILWLTLSPDPLGDTDMEWFEGADKVVHGLMFFGLTLCMLVDAKRWRDWRRMKLPLVGGITIVGLLIGMGIEFVQPLCGRSFEFRDMGADAFGAVVAGALWVLMDGALTEEDKIEGKQN